MNELGTPGPDLALQHRVERFLYLEARLLDEQRFEQWCDLFTDDGVYWMPSRHDQTSTDEVVSVFYDDRSVMASRIRRLRHPDAHVQAPVSCTAHGVSNIEIDPEPGEAGTLVVHAVFQMAEYRRDTPRWFAGRYRFELTPSGEAFRIRMKKVMLINCESALPAMAIYV
jgi:3-phenylpropionate/cinnamic acid dioxygenase small subunit